MHIVIDTNIWISGLLWGGQPAELLEIIKQGKAKACASAQMLNEVARVLGYRKFQWRLQILGYTISDLVSAVQE